MFKEVVIVGAGPAGLFAAYNLCRKKEFKVTVYDKGKNIYNRQCPVRDGKSCVNCQPCNIMCGFGGAGTFSDCKLSLSPYGVGGNIVDYIGGPKAENYVQEVEDIFDWFDTDSTSRKTIGLKTNKYTELENKLKDYNIDITYCPTKHLGTDGTLSVMKLMYEYLKSNGVIFKFCTEIINCNKVADSFILYTSKNETRHADYVIFAPGRSGNTWLSEMLKKQFDIKTESNRFDIGFRVEVPYETVSELTDNLYDMKLSKTYDTGVKVRTFCTNPKGYVSEEHYKNNIALANGHSYADKKSNNTNFAVLVTLPISTEEGISYVQNFADRISGGVAVCSFEDLYFGRYSGTKLETTLKTAKHRGFNAFLPQTVIDHFCYFMKTLDKVYPGVASDMTNVYGIEAKFYSDTIKVDENFETSISGLYCIGDGSGITRGIVQSAASGLAVTDNIMMKE